jgi:uncharacterized membrane protein
MKTGIKALFPVLCCLIIGTVLLGPVSPASGFNIKKIDVPGAHDTVVQGINDLGVAVGYYSLINVGPSYGFIYDGVNFTTINYPGASSTHVYGVNNAGHVVGDYTISSSIHGFKFDGSVYTPLDFPNATVTRAYGINDSGKIVGEYTLSGITHGFTYDGQFATLDVPSGTTTSCYGINNFGRIVGSFSSLGTTYGFSYDPILLFTALQVPGANTTIARGINDAGRIVGDFRAANPYPDGFIYFKGNYTIIKRNNFPGAIGCSLFAINKFGRMGGTYTTTIMHIPPPDEFFQHGFAMSISLPPLYLLLD